MEASGTTPAAAESDGQTQENGQPDLSQGLESLNSRVEELSNGLAPMLEAWNADDGEEETETGFDPNQELYDPSLYEDAGVDPSLIGEPEAEINPQQAQQILNQATQQAVQQYHEQHVAPMAEEFRALKTDMAAAGLEEKYPQLRDQEQAAKSMQIAKTAAERIGQPDLAGNPDFFETVFLSEMGRERAASEIPAGADAGVSLEGGGALPGQSETDLGDAIVNAGRSGDPSEGSYWSRHRR